MVWLKEWIIRWTIIYNNTTTTIGFAIIISSYNIDWQLFASSGKRNGTQLEKKRSVANLANRWIGPVDQVYTQSRWEILLDWLIDSVLTNKWNYAFFLLCSLSSMTDGSRAPFPGWYFLNSCCHAWPIRRVLKWNRNASKQNRTEPDQIKSNQIKF